MSEVAAKTRTSRASRASHLPASWLTAFVLTVPAMVVAISLALACGIASATTDCGRLSPRDCQEREARTLKASYLAKTPVVASVPTGTGHAEGIHASRSVARSLSGPPRISGTIRIERLVGRFRLKLASSRDTLQYGRKARVAGSVAVHSGRLTIYSPVDVDFWQMAALFVERPVRGEPTPEDLLLTGWKRIDVEPGKPVPFSAELIALGGDHRLLLHAPDGEARGIRFELE